MAGTAPPYNAAMDERRTPLDTLKPLAGRALEAALNRAVALDPDTRDSLRPLDGRRLVVRLATPPLALQISVDGERLRVGPVEDGGEPDLSVRATIGGLIAQLPFMRRDDAPAVGAMRIEGDADLARRLQRLAERFDPDWQQPFVAAFGDIVGVQVAQLFAGALRTAKTAAGVLAANAADYVQHETQDVVSRDELTAFYDDIDTLRDDVERIAARVARLQARGSA
ncbi:SCP2 sterol-binding domain-containing protein [Lysobacter sp. PAGU 2638]